MGAFSSGDPEGQGAGDKLLNRLRPGVRVVTLNPKIRAMFLGFVGRRPGNCRFGTTEHRRISQLVLSSFFFPAVRENPTNVL